MDSTFQIWPAIDIRAGKPVRLLKGDYAQETNYGDQFSVENLAKTFSTFAYGIHVVDLDGAKAGYPINVATISQIIKNSSVPVEVGGGIRNIADAELLFSIGVSRIILGTSALQNPEFLTSCFHLFGSEKVVVGVDSKEGKVATHGWESVSHTPPEDFIEYLQQNHALKTLIFTDIATDGTLCGPPLEIFQKLCKKFPKIDIIASGGVSGKKDMDELAKIGVKGVIFGKAFYENKITAEDFLL